MYFEVSEPHVVLPPTRPQRHGRSNDDHSAVGEASQNTGRHAVSRARPQARQSTARPTHFRTTAQPSQSLSRPIGRGRDVSGLGPYSGSRTLARHQYDPENESEVEIEYNPDDQTPTLAPRCRRYGHTSQSNNRDEHSSVLGGPGSSIPIRGQTVLKGRGVQQARATTIRAGTKAYGPNVEAGTQVCGSNVGTGTQAHRLGNITRAHNTRDVTLGCPAETVTADSLSNLRLDSVLDDSPDAAPPENSQLDPQVIDSST